MSAVPPTLGGSRGAPQGGDGPATRRELHHRSLDLRFYARDDGLYEVEGCLLDVKTEPFRRLLAAEDTPAGQPLHDIVVCLVIDGELLVHEARAAMRTAPFGTCREVEQTLAPLKGLRIGAGWNRQVRERLGGAACCTHVVEMLSALATTAWQGLAPQRLARIDEPGNEAQRQAKVDSCYTYAGNREVVARLWPHLRRGGV